MSRTLVVDPVEGVRVPFLRGILTRSLQNSGLRFEHAYRIASQVRDELAGVGEITTGELRQRVLKRLEALGAEATERYARPLAQATILVTRDGRPVPFSRGRHRADLQACGLAAADAARIAIHIQGDLLRRGVSTVGVEELRRATYERIRVDLGPDAAHNYLVWEEFKHSGRPLVLLVGGTDGSGKSTIATQVAHTVEIMKTQSTDLLREVMRVMIPERLLPFLHTSSFKAWEVLPSTDRSPEEADAFLADGYLTQAELVSVACVATVQRAVQERVSLVLEGVHVHPLLLERLPKSADAIVVAVMLAVLKPTELRQRLRGRGRRAPGRSARRYLDNFESIWRLQSFLLSEADRTSIPIVVNEDREGTVQQVIGVIVNRLGDVFRGDPGEVLA